MIAEMGGISSTGLTREGAFLGTPAYAAPEILEDARKAEPSSDVYATATMAFELLTGRLPFSSRHDPLFSTKLVERPRGLRDVTGAAWPPPLESWFERALARQPGRRFATTAQALASWRSLGNEAGPSRWVLAEARDASRIEETTWDDPG
jgi:serine/threonine-protein kinase